MPDLIMTNFNRNFTGVSTTAAAVVRHQADRYDMALTGVALPGCPDPIPIRMARHLSRNTPPGKPFTIWHVRRNTEMRAALWARDVLRLPIKIVFTSAATRRHSAFPRWLIARMDAVIATSEQAATFIPNMRAIVPHGIDVKRFYPSTDRATAWTDTGYPGTRGIATIGRIRPEKGSDRFVDAMLRLLPDHPGTTALLIGRAAKSDQAFLNSLKIKIADAGLTDRILFPGEIAPDAMPALTRSLSAIVQLPRYEGYGMVPLEGMASGVPFVASDQGNYRTFASKGTAGIIVPSDNPDATTDALNTLLTDPKRHAQMAQTARQIATTQFSIQSEVNGIDAVYQQLWQNG